MTGRVDRRHVDVRAAQVVRDIEITGLSPDAPGGCPNCGTREVEGLPDSEAGFRCAGCKEPL